MKTIRINIPVSLDTPNNPVDDAMPYLLSEAEKVGGYLDMDSIGVDTGRNNLMVVANIICLDQDILNFIKNFKQQVENGKENSRYVKLNQSVQNLSTATINVTALI